MTRYVKRTKGLTNIGVLAPGPQWLASSMGALVLLAALLIAAGAQARAAPEGFADLVERLTPAVVNISTTQNVQSRGRSSPEVPIPQVPPGSPFEEFFKDFFERQRPDSEQEKPRRRVTSLGSGFVIDPSGIIVTNNHVIKEADEITVTLSDDSRYEATVIGHDPKTDVAVLKIEADKPLPSVSWGNSDDSRVGDWVIAIGNPFGLGGTVTAGIISARQRDINAGPYDDFLQTDASINKGNSGGPMFNLAGEVIGINTAIFSPSGGSIGIGFAVPSSLARPVVDQLQKYGRTRRGWLGVRIQTVTEEIAESLGVEEAAGALVADVTKDSPADRAGVEAGDVIVSFDGKRVKQMRELPRMVADTEISRKVKVEVWRKGEIKELWVTLGELEEAEKVMAALGGKEVPAHEDAETLGMTLAAITPELRERFDLDEKLNGVVITEIEDASVAAEKGIRAGDVIIEVAQEEVSTPSDVLKKVREVQGTDRRSVLLLLQRAGDLRFVAMRVDKS